MSRQFLSLGIALCMLAPAPVFAADEAEERIEHYAAQEITSGESAIKAIEEKKAGISEILAKETLESADLENIHEASYTLEAAIDFLTEAKSGVEEQIDLANESIQAIHASSETHKEAEVREWFAKLDAIPMSDLYSDAKASQ